MRAPMVVVDSSLEGLGAGDHVLLDDDRRHHLGRVLRRRDGDPLVLTDGRGRRTTGELIGTAARLTGPVEWVEASRPDVVVAHALPKGRGLDEVVRTLAELGVAAVHPVVTARTTSRPEGDRAAKATARWRAIARAAAEQAHSARLCDVRAPVQLDQYLYELGSPGQGSADSADGVAAATETRVVAHPDGSTTLAAALADRPSSSRVRVLVGPEGGLTDGELAAATATGWVVARAGDTVIRSVHAATVLVAATFALVGRYGEVGV